MSEKLENDGRTLLRRSGQAWFIVALVGQAAFILFILGFYGPPTFSGDFQSWNNKELITGHVSGDSAGNIMFAIHVLLAAVITFGGVIQLIPFLRNRYRALHRWNGRLFILIAYIMALGGMWLTFVRGSYLSPINAVSVVLNAVLIILCATFALRFARIRQYSAHYRWAMRTFMVVNGVWFFRLGIMAWVIINQGPLGMNNTLSGPADIMLLFGSYLIPLAVLQVYFAAQHATTVRLRYFAVGVVMLSTLTTAIGVFGAIMFMWLPALTGA